MKSDKTLLKKILLEHVLIYAKVKNIDKFWKSSCSTCQRYDHRTLGQWWHFIPQSKGDSTRFELDNVNLQCAWCNWKANQWEQYKHSLYICANFGVNRAKELREQADHIKKRSYTELEEALRKVQDLLIEVYISMTSEQQQIFIDYCSKTHRKSLMKSLLSQI